MLHAKVVQQTRKRINLVVSAKLPWCWRLQAVASKRFVCESGNKAKAVPIGILQKEKATGRKLRGEFLPRIPALVPDLAVVRRVEEWKRRNIKSEYSTRPKSGEDLSDECHVVLDVLEHV